MSAHFGDDNDDDCIFMYAGSVNLANKYFNVCAYVCVCVCVCLNLLKIPSLRYRL